MRKVVSLLIFGCALFLFVPFVSAQEKVFTPEELAKYNGQDGQPAYYAYEGVVYDVTESPLWKLGKHFGHQAGEDLTGRLEGAPHGDGIVKSFPVVGTYQADADTAADPDQVMESETVPEEMEVMETVVPAEKTSSWYSGRIRIFGISILGWSGILLGVFFVLTFGTCFATPWGKMHLPWKGKRLGPDPLDATNQHLAFSSLHKHFVWWTIILGVIHGVLGILQMFGLYL